MHNCLINAKEFMSVCSLNKLNSKYQNSQPGMFQNSQFSLKTFNLW